MKKLAHLDEQVLLWVAARPSNQADCFMPKLFKNISRTGDGPLYAMIAATLFYFDSQHGNLFFYTALMAYALEVPIFIALKHFFKRPRPCDRLLELAPLVVASDKFSLPSGHTAAAFLMATIIANFYPSLSIFAFTWASLIGMSRVVLRVHFPLDVLLGALLGVTIAYMSITILG